MGPKAILHIIYTYLLQNIDRVVLFRRPKVLIRPQLGQPQWAPGPSDHKDEQEVTCAQRLIMFRSLPFIMILFLY